LERDKWEVDFGLRYQFDSITTYTQDLSTLSYDLWLPSLNSTLFIDEHWRFRFGASKNYSKPLLSSLNFADSNNTLNNIEYIFNPNLKP
ncbi:TonB-dependent receptor, partial [Achromobacter sp. SIMBA_011]